MVDPVSYGKPDRDLEQAVFRRFLCPDKDYLSFSLLYNSDERSLDLICKDQAELEVWFAGLKELISTRQRRHSRLDSQSDIQFFDNTDNLKAIHVQAEALLKSYGNQTLEFSSSLVVESSESDQSHTRNMGSMDIHDAAEGGDQHNNKPAVADIKEGTSHQSMGNGTKYRKDGETQLIEQFELGVYVTLVQLRNGTKVFKRVRFSKRKFAEQQAEEWWKKNQTRVFKKYNYPGHATSSTAPSNATESEEEPAASSQA